MNRSMRAEASKEEEIARVSIALGVYAEFDPFLLHRSVGRDCYFIGGQCLRTYVKS